MCFYNQTVFICGDSRWDRFVRYCNKDWRAGQTCGMKILMDTRLVGGKCATCSRIERKPRHRDKGKERIHCGKHRSTWSTPAVWATEEPGHQRMGKGTRADFGGGGHAAVSRPATSWQPTLRWLTECRAASAKPIIGWRLEAVGQNRSRLYDGTDCGLKGSPAKSTKVGLDTTEGSAAQEGMLGPVPERQTANHSKFARANSVPGTPRHRPPPNNHLLGHLVPSADATRYTPLPLAPSNPTDQREEPNPPHCSHSKADGGSQPHIRRPSETSPCRYEISGPDTGDHAVSQQPSYSERSGKSGGRNQLHLQGGHVHKPRGLSFCRGTALIRQPFEAGRQTRGRPLLPNFHDAPSHIPVTTHNLATGPGLYQLHTICNTMELANASSDLRNLLTIPAMASAMHPALVAGLPNTGESEVSASAGSGSGCGAGNGLRLSEPLHWGIDFDDVFQHETLPGYERISSHRVEDASDPSSKYEACSPVPSPVPPDPLSDPAESTEDSDWLQTSHDFIMSSSGSNSTCPSSFSGSIGIDEELDHRNEEPEADHSVPPDIDPDDRLVNPRYHYQKLRDLEAFVYGQSALHFYGMSTVHKAQNWEGSGIPDAQTFLPFSLHSEPKELSPSDALIHLHDCGNLLPNIIANLAYLESKGFGGNYFNLLTVDKGRPQVAHLISMDISVVEKLAQDFAESEISIARLGLTSVKGTGWRQDESILRLNDTCEHVLALLGLEGGHARHLDLEPEALWRNVVHTLDLAVLSYSGAHVSRFDKRYLGMTKDCFKITDPFLAPRSKVPTTRQHGHGITIRRRSLRCLDGFLRGKQVWVFHWEDLDCPPETPNGEGNRLYLSTQVTTLANIWGPLWGTSSKTKPEKIFEYSLGNGSIVPWPASQREKQFILPGEVLCHWISSRESLNVNAAQHGLTKFYFCGMETLLIGGGNGRTPRLQPNPDCGGTVPSFKERYKNSNCLRQTGAIRPSKNMDTQTVQIQGGGMGLSVAAGMSYKIDNGQTWKEALVERWEKEPDRRNPRALEHWFGVEVSACTENARRRRLVRVLATKTMQDYLNAVGFSWNDEECGKRYYESLSGKSWAFRELYHTRPEWRADLANAVVTSLKALRETGVDNSGALSAFWVTNPDDEWIVTLRKSEHTWASLLRDTAESGSMAVLVDQCLELDKWPNVIRRCLSRQPDNGGYNQPPPQVSSVFETAITINVLARPPGLKKPQNPSASGKNSSISDPQGPQKWSWDVSGLRKGACFQIGDAEGKHGKLTVLYEPAPDGILFMEWKSSARRKFDGGFLGREVGRHHEEHIWDGKWEFDKIKVHVMSKPERAQKSNRWPEPTYSQN